MIYGDDFQILPNNFSIVGGKFLPNLFGEKKFTRKKCVMIFSIYWQTLCAYDGILPLRRADWRARRA